MARRVNEYTADLVAKQPDRFGNFATLPLPDVDGALTELEDALGRLGADGVILLANYAGKYLGDAAFEPLWAALDSRQAIVFVDPGQPSFPTVAGVAGALALGRVLASFIYGIAAYDPLTFATVATLLAAVALLASIIPAYRAARIEPTRALREE